MAPIPINPDCMWNYSFCELIDLGMEIDEDSYSVGVTPPKLASANPVESLAIYPFKPTCDQTGNHPYKTIKVNAREGE
jgi:hypothetical protein